MSGLMYYLYPSNILNNFWGVGLGPGGGGEHCGIKNGKVKKRVVTFFYLPNGNLYIYMYTYNVCIHNNVLFKAKCNKLRPTL